ncbi:MAG: FAD-binding oxidoreductase, partial [bacterium]
MVSTKVEQMKWWGWGREGIEFDISDKPDLWPYIKNVLGIEGEPDFTPPVKFEEIELPEQRVNNKFLNTIKSTLKEDQVKTDKMERLIHAYGKSFRDLWRIRRGIVETAPDCIVYPDSEEDVCSVIRAASESDVIVIPFGGGSNIAGCLEARGNGRTVVSLDMKRMNKILSVDQKSCTARMQGGIMGPDMENKLSAFGVTLGHFPDSFEYSSLGGWVATRSAGMQSDKYGKIEDMVISLRMVTPNGTIVTRTVPKSSNGIDVNHVCIGSEGILGVITEATMQVHHIPECREFYGYLFPDFESGAEAIHQCVEKECMPVVTRFNDPEKTRLSFAFKTRSSGLKSFLAKGVKIYLKKRFDLNKACLMLSAFEGDRKTFNHTRKRV